MRQGSRVFISYAQYSEAHSAHVLVLALAQALRSHGLEVELDQYQRHELLDWPRWCQEQLRPGRSDWVLMLCSAAYRARLEDRVDLPTGKGVFWEGTWITQEIYASKGNRRFVPVLLGEEPEDAIPGIVRGWNFFRVRGLDHRDPGYADLYRLLTGQPAVPKPPIGPLLALPTRDQERRYLDRLLAEIEHKARLYAPLRGIAERKPSACTAALLTPWQDEADLALLLHRPRQTAAEARPQGYDDILAAFAEVKQAALLGAPGAGKSTTLRRLAADLARRAQADPQAPLPLLVSLGDWRGDETLGEWLAERVPEIGPVARALSEADRLVLLLDGLNEVPTARRQAKAAQVRAFRAQLGTDTPFICSCRRDDYVGDLELGLDTLTLEPLSPPRIRAVLHHWLPSGCSGSSPGTSGWRACSPPG